MNCRFNYRHIIGIMKKKKNKKNDNGQRYFNYFIIVVITALCITSYIRKKDAMKVKGIVICKLIRESPILGRSISIGKNITLEYYVERKRYETIRRKPDNSYDIGDCFLLEYSIKNPEICEVQWDKGKQNCNCKK